MFCEEKRYDEPECPLRGRGEGLLRELLGRLQKLEGMHLDAGRRALVGRVRSVCEEVLGGGVVSAREVRKMLNVAWEMNSKEGEGAMVAACKRELALQLGDVLCAVNGLLPEWGRVDMVAMLNARREEERWKQGQGRT